jgi:curved DNA-binding protein CbpA
MTNYYELLGIPLDAPQETVKKAYRDKIKKHHPDKFKDPDNKKDAEIVTKYLNEAYGILKDENERTKYNLTIKNTKYFRDQEIFRERQKKQKERQRQEEELNKQRQRREKERQKEQERQRAKKKKTQSKKTGNILFQELKAAYERVVFSLPVDAPAYQFIGEDVIKRIAQAKPKTREELKAIEGIADFHISRYGSVFLRIIKEYGEEKESR